MSFSAALCRGLIEATVAHCPATMWHMGFPRLYAAASLKLVADTADYDEMIRSFPRLYAAASLKRVLVVVLDQVATRFPRLYAAASLKHG